MAALALAGIVGVAWLWPRGTAPTLGQGVAPLRYVDAEILSVAVAPCLNAGEGGRTDCQFVAASLRSGPDAGNSITFQVFATDFSAPELSAGEAVVLLDNQGASPSFRYAFADYQRDTPLLALLGLFVVVVVLFGRWQGVRALSGLAVSLAVIVFFLLPSLLRGNPALPVALTATLVVAFAALYLAHGVSLPTTVALLGTLISLVLIAVLVTVFVALARLGGLSDEAAQVLRVTAQAVDPRGLLIAGTIVGALGVLDDVTVTQVSAVGELARANPQLSARELYVRALRIGRDHVSSTVNTLVLAYAGASLPLLLAFSQSEQPWSRSIAREVVAVEIIRTLVGSIGLVCAVPVTTALAAWVTPTSGRRGEAEPAGAGH